MNDWIKANLFPMGFVVGAISFLFLCLTFIPPGKAATPVPIEDCWKAGLCPIGIRYSESGAIWGYCLSNGSRSAETVAFYSKDVLIDFQQTFNPKLCAE